MKPALFLDRDGTLIEDPGYLSDASAVRLLPGVGEAVARAQEAGFLLVVTTNQSGVARGLLTQAQLEDVHHAIDRLMERFGARIDVWEHCPHLPEAGCDCRKPAAGMHRSAAHRLGIDLGASWCIGDRVSDLLPARALGCGALLVLTGEGPAHAADAVALGFATATTLDDAVETILAMAP